MNRYLSLPLALFAALALITCSGNPAQSTGPIVNSELGIQLAAVPAPFKVVENKGTSLQLAVDGDPTKGRVDFFVGPPQPSGVNLVAEINSKKPEIEAQPGGKFLGTVELGTPIGSAFTARGQYDGPTGRMEETWVLALHPSGDRLLSMVYRYPANKDSGKRVEQMMDLVGEVAGTQSGS